MKCLKCDGEMRSGRTTHTVDLGKRRIVVRRVPCHRCADCGEVVFSGAVMATLERLVNTRKDAQA